MMWAIKNNDEPLLNSMSPASAVIEIECTRLITWPCEEGHFLKGGRETPPLPYLNRATCFCDLLKTSKLITFAELWYKYMQITNVYFLFFCFAPFAHRPVLQSKWTNCCHTHTHTHRWGSANQSIMIILPIYQSIVYLST